MRFFRKPKLSVPVLTYHSLNVLENTYAANDHLAFESDLRTIARLGLRVIPMTSLVDSLKSGVSSKALEKCVVITIDDGSWLDYHDIVHPTCGDQRSFFNILTDFQATEAGAKQDSLHITSFVIASPNARRYLDERILIGKGWWGDDWWREANASGLMNVECHSWDHVHDALDTVLQQNNLKGDFRQVKTREDCSAQTTGAAEYIEKVTSRRPLYFAYPWGHASRYMVNEFMPGCRDEHRFEAAFSIEPRHVTHADNIWDLPRYVCGRDWKSPEGLISILQKEH